MCRFISERHIQGEITALMILNSVHKETSKRYSSMPEPKCHRGSAVGIESRKKCEMFAKQTMHAARPLNLTKLRKRKKQWAENN